MGRVAPQKVPQRLQPSPVVLEVPTALELGGAEAPVGEALVQANKGVVVQGDVQPGGAAGDEAVQSPEGAPQRLTGSLRLEVPQCHVDCTDRAERGARMA